MKRTGIGRRAMTSCSVMACLVGLSLAAGSVGQAQDQQATASAPAVEPVELRTLDPDGPLVNQRKLVGMKAVDFKLKDSQGTTHVLSEYVNAGKVVVLEWFNPTCPFVRAHYEKRSTMKDVYAKFADKGIVWLTINSGHDDQTNSVEINEARRKAWAMPYPILMDTSGAVGRAYGAKNTPTMYVIDTDGIIRYVGAIDNRRKRSDPTYVERALDAVLAGQVVETPYAKPYGCSVKYDR